MKHVDWAEKIQCQKCSAQSETVYANVSGSGPIRVDAQGLFHSYFELSPLRLTAPGSPRMTSIEWVPVSVSPVDERSGIETVHFYICIQYQVKCRIIVTRFRIVKSSQSQSV